MTEKVKVTQEQAELIEQIKMVFRGKQMIRVSEAVHLGYEIEPEYKAGDWKKVVLSNGRWAIGQIDTLAFDDIIFNYLDENTEWQRVRRPAKASTNPTPEEIKAEKERRLWVKIGREVGEFWDGDIALDKFGKVLHAIEDMEAAYQMGELSGFHPAKTYISFEKGDSE